MKRLQVAVLESPDGGNLTDSDASQGYRGGSAKRKRSRKVTLASHVYAEFDAFINS